MKLIKWQKVKSNQESRFKQELNKFQSAILERKLRLERIMGNNIIKRQDMNYRFKNN